MRVLTYIQLLVPSIALRHSSDARNLLILLLGLHLVANDFPSSFNGLRLLL